MEGSKGLLKSMSVWGGVMSIVPFIDTVHQWILSLPDGVLPPTVKWVGVGLGSVLSLVGRLRADKTIKGLF